MDGGWTDSGARKPDIRSDEAVNFIVHVTLVKLRGAVSEIERFFKASLHL